jgi:THO complex subunit 2
MKQIGKLKEELAEQSKTHNEVIQKLGSDKDSWFATSQNKGLIAGKFLQYCIFPRLFATETDAIYCAKFVLLMHDLGTPFFNTILFYRQLVYQHASIISSCSLKESQRYGLFLKDVLEFIFQVTGDEVCHSCCSVLFIRNFIRNVLLPKSGLASISTR